MPEQNRYTSDRKDQKLIFHIDVNSAFLSWSAIKLLQEGHPVDIRTIPSIVGGDRETRHGIVVAKSIPAKRYGIQTAETVVSALIKCPDLYMVPPDHTYYREQSRKLMEYLSGICPAIEQVSVDECYMDYSPIADKYSDPLEVAAMIRQGVYKTFGFTVNVGISNRKVLAKMASDFEKPDKTHTLYSWEIRQKLWPLPIRQLHMCGKSSAKRFTDLGIHTIGDLAQTDPLIIENLMKSHGMLLWNYANGIDDSIVQTVPSKAKGVGNSTTLSKDVVTKKDAYEVLKELAVSVSRRLKKHSFLAGQISVEIKYATFTSVSHQLTCSMPCADVQRIYAYACQLFDELWNGEPIRLLGIRTTKLSDEEAPVQLDLFGYQRYLEREEEKKRQKEKKERDDARRQKLLKAMEQIQGKYGKELIKKGLDYNE